MVGGIGPIELIMIIIILLFGSLLPIGSLVVSILVYLKVKKSRRFWKSAGSSTLQALGNFYGNIPDFG